MLCPRRLLTLCELNRATLARQLLLDREELPVSEAVERLVGLQAQVPNPPYVGLWTRLRDFRRDDLTGLMEELRVVRATFLVDGFVSGTWKIEKTRRAATLVIEPFEYLPKKDRDVLIEEGERLVRFVESGAGASEVRFAEEV